LPDLWAVAGPYLLRVDLKAEPPLPKLLPMPPNAGPLRSVRAVDGKILVGARGGVLVVDPTTPDSAQPYLYPNLISEHGFSSVLLTGENLWACHRDAGLVRWSLGQTDKPALILSPKDLNADAKSLASGPDGAVIFSLGTQLMMITAAGKPSAISSFNSPIVAVMTGGDQLITAAEDGTVAVFDPRTLQKTEDSRRAGKLTGAALLPWLSSSRLLLARADGPVDCVGLEDQLVTQFGGHTSVRALTACGGKVAAMSADRQRVVLWNAWDGRKPAREIYLAGVARHRVADIAFG
jgi:WD40 repeat protein